MSDDQTLQTNSTDVKFPFKKKKEFSLVWCEGRVRRIYMDFLDHGGGVPLNPMSWKG